MVPEDHVETGPRVEQRSLYIDLFDLKLPTTMRTLDDVAAATAHVYERFTPFADDGWVWLVQPSSWDFDGWVYQECKGVRCVAGAQLLCERPRPGPRAFTPPPSHHVSQHRTQQLVGQPYAAEPGTKIWRVPNS